MKPLELETTITADGGIRVDRAPVPAGHRVRLTLVDLDAGAAVPPVQPDADGKLPIEEVRRRLAGTVISYGDVMAPAYTDQEMEAFADAPLFPEEAK